MPESENYLSIKEFCLDRGADLFGVADVSSVKGEFILSPKLIKSLNSAISLGVRVSDSILEEIEDEPTRLYFHHYRALNMFLDQLALRLTNFIQSSGYKALPIPASQILDWEKQKAHLSHKKIGYLAGLGWIGRNNLLVNEGFGSRFRMVSLLTDIPLKADKPIEKNCGECLACIGVCPGGAIKERQKDFDHMACFEKLKEFQKKGLVGQYICGICVKACRGKRG